MHNIFDYLYWRGDLPLEYHPFNNIDNLILARLSYLPLDGISFDKISIKEAYENIISLNTNPFYSDNDAKLCKILATSKRYKDLIIENYANIIDIEQEEQFAALTIHLPFNTIYISYRGTDNTIIGFKEDFNLAFKTELPSQKEATNYLNNYLNTSNKIILGGHSKGGNLAIYAAMNSKDEIKDKIISIYNNDGPGFLKENIDLQKYQSIAYKINTFIPASSIIGKLLNMDDNYKVVYSNNKYIYQHDIYSWQITKDDLFFINHLNQDSIKTEQILENWLTKMNYEDRKDFINIIYQLIISTNCLTIDELKKQLLLNINIIIKNYLKIDKKNKDIIIKCLYKFITSLVIY